LGDTTVGACCPDEVTALDLDADVLVHYGHACWSPTGTLPMIYSFGFKNDLDISPAGTCITHEIERIQQDEDFRCSTYKYMCTAHTDSMEEEERHLLQSKDAILQRMEVLSEELIQMWMGQKSMDG
jgi:diphthamide biosynthesis enzyme Dph1/Dph2-like protein